MDDWPKSQGTLMQRPFELSSDELRERREDMRQMLLRLDGKVFTTASLDQLVIHTRLKEFVTTA